MTTSRFIETTIVAAMFGGYLGLWRIKCTRDARRNGVDPDVLRNATTPVQAYFARLVWFMTALVVAIVALHAVAPDTWPPLARVARLEPWWFDLAGGVLGVAGDSLSRPGAGDHELVVEGRRRYRAPHELVTRGIFAIRYPPTWASLVNGGW